MLSPDTLILLGNTLGREGYAALSGLLIASGLHVLTAWTYGRLGLHLTASVGESRYLAEAYGPLVATVLPLCARVVYTVAAATGILAIAGYVFNEVFVYWFPNLGFSFCLLGMVGRAQPGRSACGHAGAAQLCGACSGWPAVPLGHGSPRVWAVPPGGEVTALSSLVTMRSLLAGLLLFVGFELALFTTPSTAGTPSPPGHLLVLSIVLAALVFGTGLLCLGYGVHTVGCPSQISREHGAAYGHGPGDWRRPGAGRDGRGGPGRNLCHGAYVTPGGVAHAGRDGHTRVATGLARLASGTPGAAGTGGGAGRDAGNGHGR